jgi:hypothetical protein
MLRRSTLILIATLLIIAPASAVTRRVPDAYPTIQGGIVAAGGGDTVLVAAGTYMGAGNRDIDFLGKAIVVRSESGAGSTIIDCQGSPAAAHRGFFFHSGETNASILEGFTIQNGYVGGPLNGGGIECEFASPTIRACIVRDCTVAEFGQDGGGICCRTSAARIEDCVILHNFASYGGGIACRGDLSVTILRCTVTGNSANYGGGIDSGTLGGPRIVDCVVSGNQALGGGLGNPTGGGLLLAGPAVAENCVVSGNLSGRGGGVYCQSNSPLIDGCTIVANRADDGDGGGVYAMDTSTLIRRTILWDNCAAGAGNDIDAGPGGSVSFGCCIVDPSGIAQSGGVLHDLGDNLASDPQLCGPISCLSAPTPVGDFSVHRASAALPEANPCAEWIGALRVGCPAADVADDGRIHDAFLFEMSPNPATDRLAYRFDLPRGGAVRLSLVDASGRRVREVLTAELPAGPHAGGVDLRGGAGEDLRSGVYFLRLDAPGGGAQRQFVITR